MKKENYTIKIKQVDHANQHTSQKTEVVPKNKTKWPYELMDHKIPRPKH